MIIRDLLQKWHLTSLKIKTPILDMEWSPTQEDQEAAWDLYIELLTRIATQPLTEGEGYEETALESLYSIFTITRTTLKHHGRSCVEFSRIAIIVLNQVLRPFTTKWHSMSRAGMLQSPVHRAEFREELKSLQSTLTNYTGLLAELADVEDLTDTTNLAER